MCIFEKVKAAAKWVWNWATVITAFLASVPSFFMEFFNYVDISTAEPLLRAENAGRIIASVGLAKGIIAFAMAQRAFQKAKDKIDEPEEEK